ncbi:calcitonin receptor [Elysia marginata]|uniref:Calcitonin receptor n=1 Tax=Elysia marginata TaxID=1093978 RepID=A0AAV4FGA2_9GAST|nr:calcitonin receptor [Elysia marginata]
MPDDQPNLGATESYLCRDRADYFIPRQFRVSTCSMCLIYLFPTIAHFKTRSINGVTVLLKITEQTSRKTTTLLSRERVLNSTERTKLKNQTDLDEETQLMWQTTPSNLWSVKLVVPDIEDAASLKPVSQSLADTKTRRWLQCCQAAHRCCQRQLEEAKAFTSKSAENLKEQIKFKSSFANLSHLQELQHQTHVTNQCPMTWDGYSCVDATAAGRVAKVMCPSFISNKHVNPQAQASKRCTSNGTWWVSAESHMEWTDYSTCVHMDIDSACKLLNLASRLAKSSSFFWMFCEGFHLHWLMVKAFKPINKMGVYMAIGWGMPSCLVLIYMSLRIVHYNTERAMKALLLLVPLLGLQQFCILYRPHVDQPGYFVYAVVSALIVNLQGAAVAIMFCFLNSEPLSEAPSKLKNNSKKCGASLSGETSFQVQESIVENFKKLRRKLRPTSGDVTGTATALSLVSMAPRISLVPLCSIRQGREQSTDQHQDGLDQLCPSAYYTTTGDHHVVSSDQPSCATAEYVNHHEISNIGDSLGLNRTDFEETPVNSTTTQTHKMDTDSVYSVTPNEVVLRADVYLENASDGVNVSLKDGDRIDSKNTSSNLKSWTRE